MSVRNLFEKFSCSCYGVAGTEEDIERVRPVTSARGMLSNYLGYRTQRVSGTPAPKPHLSATETDNLLGNLHNTQPQGELQIRPQELPGYALLIGCDHGRLRGTENDVKSMKAFLENCGFQPEKITTLTGKYSTRAAIERKWEDLLRKLGKDDAVVIYYSGHGGYATRTTAQQAGPSHFQFLLPCDFNHNDSPDNWKGILDIEISRLLYDTTIITSNVTYILDCCHSSRLGKAPDTSEDRKTTVPKVHTVELEDSKYAQIWLDAKTRCGGPDVSGTPDFTEPSYSNPDVVRIAAAAAESTAWQRYGGDDNWAGMMTESLVKVLPILKDDMSWHNIMLMVGELVGREFHGDPQQPRSAGADYRIPFSMSVDLSTSLWADMRNETIVIQGGRALGVEEGDDFNLKPWDRDESMAITATVIEVHAFAAEAKQTSGKALDPGVAFAALSRRRRRLPVALQLRDPKSTEKWLEKSAKFKVGNPHEDECVVELRQNEKDLILFGRDNIGNVNQQAVQLASRPHRVDGSHTDKDMIYLLLLVEDFTRARNIVSMGAPIGVELFRPNVAITVGHIRDEREAVLETFHTRSVYWVMVGDSSRKWLMHYNSSSVTSIQELDLKENDRVYFEMTNNTTEDGGKGAVYVSVLGLDATGKTRILSLAQGERGIPLTFSKPSSSLKRDALRRKGLPINWPESVLSRNGPVSEYFVFVLTDKELDLRFIESPHPESIVEAKGVTSGFSIEPTVGYQIITIRYNLTPKAPLDTTEGVHRELAVSEIPAPETCLPELSLAAEPKVYISHNEYSSIISIAESPYRAASSFLDFIAACRLISG